VLSPEPMLHLALVVLATDLEATTRAIASVGVLHLLDVRRLGEQMAPIRPFDVAEQVARLDRLARSTDAMFRFLALIPSEAEAPDAATDQDPELAAIEVRVDALAAEIETLRKDLVDAQDRATELYNLLRNLRALAPLGVPLEHVRRLRYVFLTSGLLPARNLPRLRESLTRIASVIVPTGEPGRDGRVLATALCLPEEREVLTRALRSAQFEPIEVPPELVGTPEEGIAQVTAQLEAARAALAERERARVELAARVVPELQSLHRLVTHERLIAEARGLMGHSERTALITGWVPAVLRKPLEQAVHKAVGDRCVVHWNPPADVPGVSKGRLAVPILLHNPVLVRPFERLLRAYGLPRYGEIEPTALVAMAFLTMFGFMFGDVGQGAVLFVIGYFIYRRMFRYRDYAVILMECGVFAAAFGFLYGSVFGVETWLPALWLRPMEEMETLMKTAIGFGIGFLSIGLGLNLVNAVRRADTAALWERNGVLAALAYWAAVGLLLRRVTAGPQAVSLGTAVLYLAVPVTLMMLKQPVRALLRGLRQHEWPDASEVFALMVESLVEVLDTAISTISNTATFIRLAAFALSHAGLFLATFSVADAVAKAGGGSVGAAAVIALGNVVIIALEGLIVSIQSIRLEYYEFFSKFYSGGGEEYRPLRFASALPRL
jgi:V/A-type H+/Na+-transporting ATPase subunit I